MADLSPIMLLWRVHSRRILVALASLGFVLIFASQVVRVPDAVLIALARITGSTAWLPQTSVPDVRFERSAWPQPAGVLPLLVTEPLSETSELSRRAALRERPALILDGTTIILGTPPEIRSIVTPKLVLRNSTLVTNGHDLDIEVETLAVENGTIRAFPKAAGGEISANGRSGGRVHIHVHGRIEGVLRVDLSGEAGVAGTPGRGGVNGAAGEKGANAASVPSGCQRSAATGTNGQTGRVGEPGGDGTDGGAGGTLVIVNADAASVARTIEFTASGGAGGAAGAGGAGGSGGAGGPGGDSIGRCMGDGARGARGADGLSGAAGKAGRAGADGAIQIIAPGA